MPRGHRLLRTPHAGGALALLPSASSLRLGHSCKPDGSRLLRRLCGQEPSNAARAEAACGLYLASARNRRRNRMPSCLHGRLRCQEEADRQHVGQRKQRTRWECDSPFPTPVGLGNRTFPGYQPLSYFGYKVRRWKKEFLNLRLITMFSLSQAGATPGVGLQRRGACCGPAGSGRQLYKLTVRLNRFTYSALRPPPKPQSSLSAKAGDSEESHQ